MISEDDAVQLYQQLVLNGFRVWLSGGWGIDALLREHTRPHKDLDVLVLFDNILPVQRLFSSLGFQLKELWSENRWVDGANGEKTATAFVLRDARGRELDVHAIRLDGSGQGIPAWNESKDFILSPQDLAGEGMIAGQSVACLSPEAQVFCHRGYLIPEVQQQDLRRLHACFGIPLPEGL